MDSQRPSRSGPDAGVGYRNDPAYWQLLRELNAWCRDTGSPTTLNAWLAEEALRRLDAGAEPVADAA